MLEEILIFLHNRCEIEGAGLSGRFEISSGTLTLPLQNGQWYWIDGSIFNDGLHQYPSGDLTDETFTGTITPARITPALQAVVADIEAWVQEHPATDLQSESFGGYSYNRASAPGGAPVGWQTVFSARLSPWRKL